MQYGQFLDTNSCFYAPALMSHIVISHTKKRNSIPKFRNWLKKVNFLQDCTCLCRFSKKNYLVFARYQKKSEWNFQLDMPEIPRLQLPLVRENLATLNFKYVFLWRKRHNASFALRSGGILVTWTWAGWLATLTRSLFQLQLQLLNKCSPRPGNALKMLEK